MVGDRDLESGREKFGVFIPFMAVCPFFDLLSVIDSYHNLVYLVTSALT